MSNAQKTPLALGLNNIAQRRATDAVQQLGKGLPCHVVAVSGAIITVQFDISGPWSLPQRPIPLFGPEYIRYPIKVGDLGVAISLDVRIGGNDGLGAGTAAPADQVMANLSNLVFLPIANTAWSSVNPNAVTVYGPAGVVLQDTDSNSIFTLTPTSITMVSPNGITATVGGTVLSLTTAGWSLSGTSGSMNDGIANTSPAIMNAAWTAMVTWLNGHDHTSASSGSPTSTPIVPFSGGNIAP
jgi:hypothetical protein